MGNKIYLTGFEVFYPNALAIGAAYKAVCEKYGFVGMFPKDNVINKAVGRSKQEIAEEIFHANIKLLEEADIITSNLNPFRGAEPDSGTVFEVGYAYAKGKKLYGYMDKDMPLKDKVAAHWGAVELGGDGRYVDKEGLHIENLELPLNLMLGVPVIVVFGTFEDCIKRIYADLVEA
ncbi:nucleoside 2-deoxyribosyltransferase [Paenibacillus agricola]|uniref:Nucleoside 2-deoxyribosyltransferase n=1 Tax=Paenibacillus agricola TaxID=2716264 RepID=A0ABX0IXC9_9BACL|nr:nucleoside 2-deoxyribosyltransferase [Paenibacillus agricola]NHN28589.1 nucleoside 2-deoxyribosyltransferase [Paenibacillus agricola]